MSCSTALGISARIQHKQYTPPTNISIAAGFLLTQRWPSSLSCRSHCHSHSFLPQAFSIGSSAGEHVVDDAKSKRKPLRRSIAGVDQDELVDPTELADADSFFCEFNGVNLHYKICDYEETQEDETDLQKRVTGSGRPLSSSQATFGLPMILLHGFGASSFSWHRVMKPLARLVGSKVLAFDRPAFGFTARTTGSIRDEDDRDASFARPLNPYSMAFSVLATLFFVDLLTAASGYREEEEGKAILVGHSAGCLVAVETYFEAPKRVAALILVAPAIFAPLATRRTDKEEQMRRGSKKEDGNSLSLVALTNPFMRFWKALANLFTHLIRITMKVLKGMKDMVAFLYTKAVSAFLRSTLALVLIRWIIDKFGVLAIQRSWFDPNQLTDYIVQGYTKPLKAKGWDMALLEYILAVLTKASTKPPLSKRLAQISCPVLIVTGDSDCIVPSWNAERLSRVIPGSSFEVVKNCGHLPHEEKDKEFLLVVERFLQCLWSSRRGICPRRRLNTANPSTE